MPTFPLVAHTFAAFTKVYLSQRDLAPPGSGTWSGTTLIFDGTLSNSFEDAETFSAGGLAPGDDYGIVVDSVAIPSDIVNPTYLGNGSPTTPITITFPGISGNYPAQGYWDVSRGGFTYGGAKYVVIPNSGVLVVIKSTNNGATWAIQDAAHQPGYGPNFALIQRVDSKIYILTGALDSMSNSGLAFFTFDMSRASNQWSAQFGFDTWGGHPNLVNAGANPWSNGIFPFANGDIGVVVDSEVGSNLPVYRLWTKASASWGSEISIPGAMYANSVIDPSEQLIHVFTYNVSDGRGSAVIYSTVTHAGVVTGSIATIPVTAGGNGDGVGHCAILNGMIFVPRDDFADGFNSVWVGALPAPSTFLKEALPIPTGESNIIVTAGPGGSLGSGYAVNDTGTINGGATGFLAKYQINSIHNNIINAWSIGPGNLGTGYAPGDQVSINGGTTAAVAQILTIGGGGAVATLALLSLGAGYSTGVMTTTTLSGGGSGLDVDILSVTNGVSSLTITDPGGGYSVANNVGTTPGGTQPGSGSGLQIDIFAVGAKRPCTAYMMFPNGYSLLTPPTPTLICPIVSTGMIGVPFSTMLLASGGTPPYTFAITG